MAYQAENLWGSWGVARGGAYISLDGPYKLETKAKCENILQVLFSLFNPVWLGDSCGTKGGCV